MLTSLSTSFVTCLLLSSSDKLWARPLTKTWSKGAVITRASHRGRSQVLMLLRVCLLEPCHVTSDTEYFWFVSHLEKGLGSSWGMMERGKGVYSIACAWTRMPCCGRREGEKMLTWCIGESTRERSWGFLAPQWLTAFVFALRLEPCSAKYRCLSAPYISNKMRITAGCGFQCKVCSPASSLCWYNSLLLPRGKGFSSCSAIYLMLCWCFPDVDEYNWLVASFLSVKLISSENNSKTAPFWWLNSLHFWSVKRLHYLGIG